MRNPFEKSEKVFRVLVAPTADGESLEQRCVAHVNTLERACQLQDHYGEQMRFVLSLFYNEVSIAVAIYEGGSHSRKDELIGVVRYE